MNFSILSDLIYYTFYWRKKLELTKQTVSANGIKEKSIIAQIAMFCTHLRFLITTGFNEAAGWHIKIYLSIARAVMMNELEYEGTPWCTA